MRISGASNKRNSSLRQANEQQQQRKSTKGPGGQSVIHSRQNTSNRLHNVDAESRVQGSELVAAAAGPGPNSSLDNDEHRKQNHCEIEKRRRDKMNHYIMELASVIPSFVNNQSKLDKLSVLRMAVQHVKSLRSSLCSFSSFHLRPSFLSSGNLLKNLILQMASREAQDNLFMVVTCDRGKVLFVSQSSKDILNQDKNELVGQSLFDILHKDDVSKVKEQISYFNLMPKEMLVDSKTLQPIKHNQRQSLSQLKNQANSTPQPGARRSFFCRMKSGRSSQNSGDKAAQVQANAKEKAEQTSEMADRITSQPGNTSGNLASVTSNHQQREREPERCAGQLAKGTNEKSITKSCIYPHSSCYNIASNQDDKSLRTDTNGRSTSSNCTGNGTSAADNIDGGPIGTSCTQATIGLEAAAMGDGGSACTTKNQASGDNQTNRSAYCNDNLPSTKTTGCNQIDSGNTANKTFNDSASTNTSSSNSKKHLRYIVMHCTGYLKAITLRNDEIDDDDYEDCNSDNSSSDDEENDSYRTVNCLIAVCRRSPMDRDLKPDRPLTFTCRYSMEGKFVFVDQRTTVALGYTPQQLLGTSHYAYCHKDSVNTFKECHRQSILKSEPVSSDIYQFKRANGQYMWLQTSLKSFRNPWTKFIDYIVANHTTAEGNDGDRYNEGCVPTKFNQDMTGDVSQSSSPASSSSLSFPSVDSKKSSSPSSSSIGSSYSMDSYNSGTSIQVLLKQIDKVKSGKVKPALGLNKRKGSNHLSDSSSTSARKSNSDSGNYSDPQSCSSLSSQTSSDYHNLRGANNFAFNPNNQLSIPQNPNVNSNNNDIYFDQKLPAFASTQQEPCANQDYNSTCAQSDGTMASVPGAANPFETGGTRISKGNPRMGGKAARQQSGSTKQHQRNYDTQYYPKNSVRTRSSRSSDTGNESATWSSSGGSVYSTNSSQRSRQSAANSASGYTPSSVIKDGTARVCKLIAQQEPCEPNDKGWRQSAYIIQSSETPQMNIATPQAALQNHQISQMNKGTYTSDLVPMTTYVNQEVDSHYTESGGLNSVQRMTNDLQQANMTIATQQQQQQQAIQLPMQQQQQQQQHQQQQNHPAQGQLNVPMIWNSTGNSYHQNLGIVDNSQAGQVCNGNGTTVMNMDVGNSDNQLIGPQMVPCQQCVNHKCSNQQLMMSNNADLNSINLSSLAVGGDLDEDQLLEYLAGCDPEAQFYHIQNSAFPQYNIYK